MLRCFLGAKLHRMVVTDADVGYPGSITIDRALLEVSGIAAGERVQVADLDNGERFETYVIEAPAGSGTICINGAAALLVRPGHRVIVMEYVWVGPEEPSPAPRIVLADDRNLNPRLLG